MNTHPLQVGYLVIGLIFLGLAGAWGLDQLGLINNPDPGVVFSITLVAAGAVGLLASAKRFLSNGSHPEPTLDHNGNQTEESK